MMTQKYVIICILLYFIGVYLFFTTQFVSHKQIHGYSTNSLLMIDGYNGGQMMGDKQSNLNQNIINKNITNLQVSQVVLIIIDALRYDYLQRIPFFKQTLQKYPKTTLIKKSIVGNPTMTTQRIESLMTGSQIFTSTNILDMFLSQKITTDNIVDQLIQHNKTLKVFGDDTWVKLFNISQQNSYVCDSTFNIRDYDSCDQLIYQNLPKFIKKAQNKKTKQIKQNQQKDNYDKLLIAHFLSLDHIGHSTSSISSHFMEQKMQKISLYLEYLIQLSADDTMFIITGDHGMRQDGNHGGNTHAETQSLFFAYYKNIKEDYYKNIKEDGQKQQNFEQRIKNFESTVVNQVDLTPTLSLLLGVNNPINSIGYPVIEILPSKYQKYLSTISYNILLGYERIINNYNSQQSSISQFLNSEQCITKIKTIKQSIFSKQSEQLKQFKHHIQLKQYIKRQIQQSKCLSGSLSMTLPNNILVVLSLIIIGVSFLLLVGRIVYSELKLIILRNNTIRLLSQLFTIFLQHIGWISSLFVIYFSWYLIRNSSTYMLLIIVIYIALISSSIMTIGRKLIIILLLLLLTQYQPYKINQYQQNYFNLQIIQSLINEFTTIKSTPTINNNNNPQVIQTKLTLHIICIAIWTIIQIKSYLKVLFKYNKSIKSKGTNRNDIKYNKNQSNITSSFKITTYLTIFLLIINIIQIIINQKLININNNHNNNNMIASNSIKFHLRYVIFITISILLYCFQYYNFKHQNIDQQKQQYKHAILMVGFGQIVGYQNFISLLIYLIIIQLIFTTKQHQKLLTIKAKNNKATTSNNNKTCNQNKNNKSSYQQNKGLKIILISLLAEYMWWILGNRYQYSSIDIKKSYLFADQFNIYLNTIAMLLWFMAPYIISIYFTFQYLSLYKQSQSTTTLQLQQQESQQFNNNNNNMNQQHSSLSSQSPSNKQTSLNNSTTTYYLNITKLLLIPLSGLLSSSINLYLNNMKILFTIVYVPLFILGMVKTIIITSIIIIGFIIIMVMKK